MHSLKNKTVIAFILSIFLFSITTNVGIANGMDSEYQENKSFGTKVSGIIIEDSTWKKENSPYILEGNIQIGATLKIESGVEVLGNGHQIQMFGELNAIGSENEKIFFRDVSIRGGDNYNGFTINIEHSEIINSSLYEPSGNPGSGRLTLKNSYIEDLKSYMYIWYPDDLCIIEKNIFVNSGAISTSGHVNIMNNIFINPSNNGYYGNSAIEVWNDYPTFIEYNSFLISNESKAISLKYSFSKVASAKNNYWGTTNKQIIDGLIHDKNDDLALSQYIDYDPILSEPHINTPVLPTPQIPSFNNLTNNERIISGTTEPNSTIQIEYLIEVPFIYEIISDTTGKFNLEVDHQIPEDTIITGVSTKYGANSDIGRTIVKDVIPPQSPGVYVVTDQSTEVTGKAEVGSTLEVSVDREVIGSGTATEDGLFSVSIPVQQAGTIMSITATDRAGNVSETTKVVVADVTAPGSPQANKVTDQSKEVTGKAEANSNIEISVAGEVIGSGTTKEDGLFSVTIPVQKAGTILSIKATDQAGNVSEATEVVVKDVTAPDKPQVNEVTDQSKEVTGKAEANSTIEISVDGEVIGSETAKEDGLFSVSIPVQKAGTILSIKATDQSDNVSEATEVVVKDVTAPDKPQVNEVTDQSKEVTGEAEVNSTIELSIDGEVIGSGTAKEDGLFSVSIPVQIAGTILSIKATDQSNNISEATEVVVKDVTAPDKPQVNEVTDQSKQVTGKAEANSTIEVSIDGEIIGSGTAKEDGLFSVSIPVQKAGTILSINATDQAGNVSITTEVVVRDVTAPDKPQVNEVTNQSKEVTGTAEATSTIEVSVDGEIIGTGTSREDGLFSVSIPVQKAGTILSIKATDQAGNVSETETISVKPELKEWVPVDGKWYYFDPVSGEKITGWSKINGIWYYFISNGEMQTGWNRIGGKWYYLSESGAMQSSWTKIDNTWYYMSGSGEMQTGWTKIGSSWYYLANSGAMQTGWTIIGNTWYYLTDSGEMQTGWTNLSGTWYYLANSGAMQTGWSKVGSSWYYHSSSGAMQTGWSKIGGSWYYLTSSGAMQTGWISLSGKWYYLYSNGAMATNTIIGGHKIDSNGIWIR